ncbi:hypothetical protein FRC05_006816, partial [Tulasnella sp. 425]
MPLSSTACARNLTTPYESSVYVLGLWSSTFYWLIPRQLSANFEARKTHRLIQALVPKEENISGCSELHCPTIAPLAIRPLYELNENDIRSVQAAKYNKQAVIVK